VLKKGEGDSYLIPEYLRDLNRIRVTVGLGMLALLYRHKDKSVLEKFFRDTWGYHITGTALAAVGEPIHVFEGDPNKYNEKWIADRIKRKIRDGEEPNGVLVPPPEEIFENEENLAKFANALSMAIYKKYWVLLPEDDIITAMKKAYSITNKIMRTLRALPKKEPNATEKARKKMMEHPAFQEYIQFLQEFAGIEPKQQEQTIAQKRAQPVERIQTEERTIIRTPTPEVPAGLTNAKLEVLSMLQALKLLNHSEEAVNNAIMDFKRKIMEIVGLENPTPKDVYRLGLYYLALSYIREGKFERAEKIFREL